ERRKEAELHWLGGNRAAGAGGLSRQLLTLNCSRRPRNETAGEIFFRPDHQSLCDDFDSIRFITLHPSPGDGMKLGLNKRSSTDCAGRKSLEIHGIERRH